MPVTNTIKTSDIVVPFAVEYERNCQILMNGSTVLNKSYKTNSGMTINLSLPSVGSALATGPATTPGNIVEDTVPITLIQYNKSVSLETVEQTLEMESFDDQVAVPYGAQMASEVQTIACNKMLLGADTMTVLGSGTAAYSDIGKAIGVIKGARAFGMLCGGLGTDLATQIQNSGLTLFNPSSQLSNNFLNGGLGKFRGADWFETPDISSFTSGSRTLGAGTAVRLKTAVTVNGSTSLVLEVAGGTATMTGTIAAGEAFTLSNVFACDIYEKALGSKYQFIAQELSTAGSNEFIVTVKGVYFTGPKKNVSTSTLAATTAVTFSHANSSTYLRGFAWAKAAFIFASFPVRPLSNTIQKAARNPSGITFLCQAGGDINAGTDIVRWDTIAGFGLARSNWVHRIDVLVS